ncbi:IS3 family transposase, partial [Chitinophaga barathri]|uniref:IS3 family transposase n=1 Tax=Chitinophaga barathri TaxID=1647451 RepID=UPI001619F72B
LAIGRDRFFDLLRAHNLLVKKSRKYVYTTHSRHHYRKWPNLIQNWRPQLPGQLWVSDITYLRTPARFLYLSLVTDACSRKIVGYHLSQQLKVKGCLSALQKAIKDNKAAAGNPLIHHSDRGIQYCCDAYVTVLTDHRIRISMTQSGSPYDNAIAERVNGILKSELGLDKTFQDYAQAVAATHQAIHLYNQVRIHRACAMRTPQMVHQGNQHSPLLCQSKSVLLTTPVNLQQDKIIDCKVLPGQNTPL